MARDKVAGNRGDLQVAVAGRYDFNRIHNHSCSSILGTYIVSNVIIPFFPAGDKKKAAVPSERRTFFRFHRDAGKTIPRRPAGGFFFALSEESAQRLFDQAGLRPPRLPRPVREGRGRNQPAGAANAAGRRASPEPKVLKGFWGSSFKTLCGTGRAGGGGWRPARTKSIEGVWGKLFQKFPQIILP